MALARHQFTVVNETGDIQATSSIEVRRESDNGLASLFSDRNGASGIGNPFNTDAEGFSAFHVVGGAYKIVATKGAFSRTYRYVGVGLASETDNSAFNSAFGATLTDDEDALEAKVTLGFTQIYATDYGVVADNATDDTGAWNAIIADVNATTGKVSIVLPKGVSRVSTLNPFLVDHVWLVAEGGSGSFIKHSSNPGLAWGNDSVQTVGGGTLGVGFGGSSTVDHVTIYARNAARLSIFNPFLYDNSVSVFMQLGDATGNTVAATVHVQGLRGGVANVACPLFDAQSNLGLFIGDYQIFVAVATGSQNAARHFILMDGDTCDTIEIGDGLAEIFASPVVATAGNSTNHHRLAFSPGSVFDNCLTGPVLTTTGSGTIFGADFRGYIVALSGNGLELNGSNVWKTRVDVRIQWAGDHGIVATNCKELHIGGTTEIYNVNEDVSSSDGIFCTSVTGLVIDGVDVGADVTALGLTGIPRYGVNIVTCEDWHVWNVRAAGSTAKVNFDYAGTTWSIRNVTGHFDAAAGADTLSPAQITGDQNDYNPTGFMAASVLRLSTDASRNITGLTGGQGNRRIKIHNVGAQNIVLVDASGSSSAANQFALTGNLTIVPDQCVHLQYDTVSDRWRSLS